MKYKEVWVFYQYKTGRSSHPNENDPDNLLFVSTWLDHTAMKEFSANESEYWREIYPDYCSDYDKFVLDD